MENNCVFCKIVKGEIPAKIVQRAEDIVVFHDAKPAAKTHFLIVPRAHIKSFLDIKDNHFPLLTNMLKVVQTLVKDKKLEGGYRVLINGGSHQVVDHLHIHLLSNQRLVD